MRYLIALVVTILVIIFVIIKLLSGGGTAKPTLPNLATYAGTDTSVRYIIDNPTQANPNHRDIVVTVGKDQATLTVTQGYEGEVIKTQSYANNTTAYSDFLRALDKSGNYTAGDNDKSMRDQRGYCATGTRFSYDIVDKNDNLIQHYWSTSCSQKTFHGRADVVQQLFESQIPDFDTLTADVDY